MTHKEYLKQVGIEIKVARIRKDMTTLQVSQNTGLSSGFINRLEAGQSDCKLSYLKRVTDAIGVSLKDIM